jgi:ectoine hydroxylase-related dioxygenase (phytanoyl-CoA dioxygenase family)
MNIGADVEAYRRDGFLVVRGAVKGGALHQIERELDRMREDVESGFLRGNHLMENERKARVIFNPYDHSPALRELVGRADMVECAKAMLGGAVQLHHTKLMCKPALEGTDQPWHQDYYYWPGTKPKQVAVFLCIDPSTEANGCLRCIPGSHLGGLREHRKLIHETTGERHWVCDPSQEELDRQVLFLGDPGDMIFFGSLTVHGSEGNKSATARRAVIYEYDELGNLSPTLGWGAPAPAVEWT